MTSTPATDHPFAEDWSARTRAQLDRPTSHKWSRFPGTIGAWVAETDFGTAPAVTAALQRALDEDELGYLSLSTRAALADATANWHRTAYGWDIAPAQIRDLADVLTGYEFTLSRVPEGAVIVPTPAYMPFLSLTAALGREVIEVPGRIEEGRWVHDLDGIDAAFAAGGSVLVLCNPHNPTGSVATRAELVALAETVERHEGRVFSDEIHAPLRFDAREHIPYASVSALAAAHTITATSASKAWNLPGLRTAQLILSRAEDAAAFDASAFAMIRGANTPGALAAIAAYTEGSDWLAELIDYLDGNRRRLGELLAELLPEVRWNAPEATYIAWLDVSALNLPTSAAEFFREHAGVALTDGTACGTGYGDHVRLVFAMPRPLLDETVRAMADAVRTAQG